MSVRGYALSKHEQVSVDDLSPSALLAAYLHTGHTLLARDGLQLREPVSLEEWKSMLETAPETAGINPSFDPDVSLINDGYGVFVEAGDGRIVGCAASRLLITPAYFDEIRSGNLWFSRVPVPGPIDSVIEGAGPSGRIGHAGGYWVHPDWRGIGISWLMPRMVHALNVLRWWIDHHSGVVFAGLQQTSVPTKNYGVTVCELAVDGYFSPTGKRERLFHVGATRDDILSRTRRDLERMTRNPDQKMRDLAPIASKR